MTLKKVVLNRSRLVHIKTGPLVWISMSAVLNNLIHFFFTAIYNLSKKESESGSCTSLVVASDISENYHV